MTISICAECGRHAKYCECSRVYERLNFRFKLHRDIFPIERAALNSMTDNGYIDFLKSISLIDDEVVEAMVELSRVKVVR